MKTLKFLILALLLFSQLHAQNERSVFRRGYLRFGINSFGNSLDNNLSPKENIFKGNYGAGSGYVFEAGHIFYFKPKSYKGKINFGLDWTILSATYNKLEKWNAYAEQHNGSLGDNALSASLSSKLGPVASFNLVEKLVLDARVQLVATGRITPFEYDYDESGCDYRYFAFSSEGESIKNVVAFGMGTNFGITLRRKAIGLSADYTSVKANTSYESYDGEDNNTYGKQKIPTNSFQFKLSFTF